MRRVFSLVAGHPALDLVNTVAYRADPRRVDDLLRSYDDLLNWALRARQLSAAEAVALRGTASVEPGDASSALERARAMRELIYRLVIAARRGDPGRAQDLNELNRLLAHVLSRTTIGRRGATLEWGWRRDVDLDRPLWPVVRAFAEWLVGGGAREARQCAAPECGWLFLDASRNHSRRWCRMSDCGNRAKARRRYQRRR
jgi:predicted RNA-binding Zn ribbon-like protein